MRCSITGRVCTISRYLESMRAGALFFNISQFVLTHRSTILDSNLTPSEPERFRFRLRSIGLRSFGGVFDGVARWNSLSLTADPSAMKTRGSIYRTIRIRVIKKLG